MTETCHVKQKGAQVVYHHVAHQGLKVLDVSQSNKTCEEMDTVVPIVCQIEYD